MSPDYPTDPRQALEASITALLLGELPADQAAFLRHIITQDPELAKLQDQLKRTIGLVRETASSPVAPPATETKALKLSEERRQLLFRQFKTVTPKEFAEPRRRTASWLVPVGIAAVLTLLVGAMLLPALSRAKAKAQTLSALNARRMDLFDHLAAEADKKNVDGDKRQDHFYSLNVVGYAQVTNAPAAAGAPLMASAEQKYGLPLTVTATTPAEAGRKDGTIVLPAGGRENAQEVDLFAKSDDANRSALAFGGFGGRAGGEDATKPGFARRYGILTETPGQNNAPQSFGGGGLGGGISPPPTSPAAHVGDTAFKFKDTNGVPAPTEGKDAAGFYFQVTPPPAAQPTPPVSEPVLGLAAPADAPGQSALRDEKAAASNGDSTFTFNDTKGVPQIPDGGGDSVEAQRLRLTKEVEKQIAESKGDLLELKAQESIPIPSLYATDNSGVPPAITAGKPLAKEESVVRNEVSSGPVAQASDGRVVLPEKQKEAVAEKLTLGDAAVIGKEFRKSAEAVKPEGKPADRARGEIVGRLSELALNREADMDRAKVPIAPPPPVPQPEVAARDNPFSTFSLNVSDVSFKLAAASLEQGVIPQPGSIRSEEFINAFDYRDPEPSGAPIAFAWERSRYPFTHNRDLLRFSVKTAAQGRQAGRPLNLVLLLDNSGSMERADRVQIIREALRVLAAQLQPQDTFSIVTFARTARLWVDGIPGNQAANEAEKVAQLTPEGGTNLEEAMDLGYTTALRHYLANGINRVVVLTDGAANLGNVEADVLKAKVEAHRKQGIALDCFGIGWEGYNDDLLEVLSRNGDGRYGFINTPEEAATEFAGQLAGALRVAASDVKVQVQFNPSRVTIYRQVGYAKHQLTKEQFRDNTVDAAEIGAAEAGNALYVVETDAGGVGPIATVRVRYKVPGTTDYRENEWFVPYNGTATTLEQSSPAMRLAATAGAFSEWLAGNPYAGEVSSDSLLAILAGIPNVYSPDQRPKKLEWMLRQAKSISGK